MGAGNDTLYRFNGDDDRTQIRGLTSTFSNANFLNLGNGRILLNLGDGDTLTFVDSSGDIKINYGTEDDPKEFTFEPAGMIFSSNRRSVILTSDYRDDDDEFDANDYDDVRSINAGAVESELHIIGNDLNNAITVGSGGGSVEGGEGADSIYGGDGNDIFIYTVGSGSDTIYNYGEDDIIQIYGVSGELGYSSFVPSADGNVRIDLGEDTLTLVNPYNEIDVEYGATEITNDFTFEKTGITVAADRSSIAVDDDFPETDLDLINYGPSIVTIDSTRRTDEFNISANDRDNIIIVGSGGGLVNGETGNDVIYGGNGRDVYVYTLGSSGNDTIYNFNSTDESNADVIQVLGVDEIDKSVFNLSNNNIVQVSLGTDTLTLVAPKGTIALVDQHEIELITFDAGGSSIYGDQYLQIGSDYNDTLVDASNYSSDLTTISAATYEGEGISIVGNSLNNVIRAGVYNNTLDGGRGTDSLYGDNQYKSLDTFVVSVGSGNKYIYNYSTTLEGAEDVVALVGDYGDIDESSFNEVGTNTTLTVGSNRIVFVNPLGDIIIGDENGSEIFTYGLSDGLNITANKKSIEITDDYQDSTFDARDYNSSIEIITARSRTEDIEIIGNNNDNIIRAGTGTDTLDGGAGNDILHGNTGADVFRYTPGQGKDSVYDFDGSDEDNPDLVMITGLDTLSQNAIRQLSNGGLEISVGSGSITLVEPVGGVTIVNEYGEELTTFKTSGTTLSSNSRVLYVGADYEDTIVTASNYSTLVATIDASTDPNELMIVGNSNSNVLKAGSGGSTLDGGDYVDYLYGGDGADLFRYRAGEGNDYIYNFNSLNEDSIDAIQILNYSGISRSNFRDTGNGNTVIQIGTNTLTLVEPVGAITVFGEDLEEDEPFVYGKSLQAGVTYNFNKTKLTISKDAELEDEEDRTFDVEQYSNNLRNVDASSYDEEVILLGDDKANELRAGSGGSSIDGRGGIDKLYGGAGADTFVYTPGEGNDYIYNYNASVDDALDIVQILGDTTGLSKESFRESGSNTILRLGANQLTFVAPIGGIHVVNGEGEEVITYDSTLPSGASYSTNKQTITITRNAELDDPTLDMSTLSNALRNINGSAYEEELNLIGNDKPNELRAGSGGSTLDGGLGTDKLYGGTGTDVFVISLNGGNDQIYNYDGDGEDVLMLFGTNALTKSSFQDSNNNTFLKLGNQKIMLDNPNGAIKVIDENFDEIITYGSNLPSGVTYQTNKTRLVIGADAELDDDALEFDISDYVNNLTEIDASNYADNPLTLIGDGQSNVLRAGSGGSSLNGGQGSDKLYGSSGADTFAYNVGDGNDYIYNYDGSQEDIIQLFGTTALDRSNFRDSNGNVILTVGSNNLTFVNPIGPILIADENGNTLENATYEETLPNGLTYNATRTKLTIGRIDELEDNVIDMATLSNNIKDLDATRYEYPIVLVGNDKANELRAGSGGSSLDGGYGSDKLYGGAGADTYVVSVGAGNDVLYNYNGNEEDVIQVFGVDTLTAADFADNGSNIILTIDNDKVVLNNPTGTIRVLIGDSTEEVTYGGDLPSGVTYSTDKTTMYIKRDADLDDEEFDMSTLSNNLRNIDGSEYEGALNLKGNDKANELRSGSGGSTLDGGYGNDKLYGGAGEDLFVYSLNGGYDYIYNFNGSEGDKLQVYGIDSLDESAFRENGRNTLITFGSERLTLVDAVGRIEVLDENGDELITFNEDLPEGVWYNSNKSKLTIGSEANLSEGNEFDMSTLASNLREIDATAYANEIILKGNAKANELYAGSGNSSLDGGAGNDKLYGGDGEDTFAYVAGEGSDYIYNYSGAGGDLIQIYGISYLDESAFRDSGDNVVLTIGNNSLTIVKPSGQLNVVDENGTTLATYNDTLPDGVRYENNKQKLVIGSNAELESPTVSVSDYIETLKDIDASAYNGELELIGDGKANELKAGGNGNVLDGGQGNDKLYGGAGADTYRYIMGDGNDYIYNFNGTDESTADVIQLIGASTIDQSAFRDSGKNTILTLDGNRLTFVNPKGQLRVVDENGEELATYGTTLPSGVTYNGSKSKLTIGRNADLSDGNEFDMATLSSNLREIDGAAYDGELILTGNARPNELRAGSGGSTLDGGEGADKLYGGTGADVFAYEEGGGNDRIYNFDGSQGDVLMLKGTTTAARSDFKDSGNNVVLTVGSNKVTFVKPTGQIRVVDEDGEEITTYGEDLPSGVTYNSTRTALTIADGADVEEIDMANYNNDLRDVDATRFGGEIRITGNALANELKAGSGGSTLNGGLGADKLYGGAGTDIFEYVDGEGNDRIYNYSNADGDMIVISGLDEIDKSAFRESGKNTLITVGNGKLTIVNAPAAIEVSLEGADETFTYGKVLPDGVSYNGSKNKLTISADADLSDGNEFRVEEYSNNLKDINGTKYDGELALIGDDKANELKIGSGGGTLAGGNGNDKLYAGAGADVIVYSGGSDVVYNFDAENDKVELDGATVSSARINGNDIVYMIGNGSLTLKNASSYGIMSIDITALEENAQQPSNPLEAILMKDTALDFPTDFEPKAFEATTLTPSRRKGGLKK